MGLIGTLKATDSNNSYKETINNAYFKIETVNLDTESQKVRIQVRGWLSEYARHNQGVGIFKRVFYISIDEYKDVSCDTDSLKAKSYELISKFPEFSEAEQSMEKYTGSIDTTPEMVDEHKKELDELITELSN